MELSRIRRVSLAVGVFISGLAGMLGSLTLVFMYQNAFGKMYYAIGGLFAGYMLGLVTGSAAGSRWIGRLTRSHQCNEAVNPAQPPGMGRLVLCRAAMVLTCPMVVYMTNIATEAVFFAAIFSYALTIGLEYPVANHLYRSQAFGRRAAGMLHSMDHLGAAAATLVGATLILPLVGPKPMLIGIACMHLPVLAAFVGLSLLDRRPARVAPE